MQVMTGLLRTIAVGLVALWLPLCCCQVLALTSDGATCCATDTIEEQHCCCDAEEDEAPAAPADTCTHCTDKGMPPAPISLDSFFIATAIPHDRVVAPNVLELLMVHATDLTGRWSDPPPESPPGIPSTALVRCAQLSTWLI